MPRLSLTHGETTCPPNAARERVLIGLVILALARSGAALCAEEASFSARPPGLPDLNLPRTSVRGAATLTKPTAALYAQDAFAAPRIPDDPVYSSKEFRPRGLSVSDNAARAENPTEPNLMGNTTVWQRLSEYRSRNRVRVLTLWESGASTVSLQAGRKGDPSLQWTSRLMNRGGATRGILDQLFAVSVAGASSGLRHGSRAASVPQAGIKPMRMEAVSK